MADVRAKKQRSEYPEGMFAPITKEEVDSVNKDMFAPVTKEELEALSGGPTAAISSFLNELALGNLPQLIGASRYLVPEEGKSREESYVSARDEAAKKFKEASNKNEGAAAAGKALGFTAGFFTGGQTVKGAEKLLGKASPALAEALMQSPWTRGALGGALGGATAGALQSPVIREGDVGDELTARAEQAGVGALLGAPLGVAGTAVSKMIQFPMDLANKDLAEREAMILANTPLDELNRTERVIGDSDALRAERVTAAGKQLGIVPTPGMLSSDPVKRNLEDSLANTPTAIGRMVGNKGREVRGQLSIQAANMMKDRIATGNADYDAGLAVKEQLKEVLGKVYAPIKDAYAQISQEMGNIALSEEGKKSAIRYWQGRLKNSTSFLPGSPEQELAKRYIDRLPQIKTAEQLRMLAGDAAAQVNALRSQGKYVPAMSEIPSALERLADREIQKAAVSATGRTQQGRQLAAQLMNMKNQTDREYASLKRVFEQLRANAGLKSKDTMGTVIDALDDIPPEDLINGLFDRKNIDALKFFSKEFPLAFDTMRKHKLRQIFDKSQRSISGEDVKFTDPKAFLREIDQMPDFVKQTLFGTQTLSKLEPLEVLTRAIPGPVNPSGTSYGTQYIENFWNPTANVRDIGRFMMLSDKGPMSFKNIPTTINKAVPYVGAASGGLVAAAGAGQNFQSQPMVEGFPLSRLQPLPPEMSQQYTDSVKNDPNLSVSQKAKLINLATKHKMMPGGQ